MLIEPRHFGNASSNSRPALDAHEIASRFDAWSAPMAGLRVQEAGVPYQRPFDSHQRPGLTGMLSFASTCAAFSVAKGGAKMPEKLSLIATGVVFALLGAIVIGLI
jgi:hypothetical protein